MLLLQVGKIVHIIQPDDASEVQLYVSWFYRPEEAFGGRKVCLIQQLPAPWDCITALLAAKQSAQDVTGRPSSENPHQIYQQCCCVLVRLCLVASSEYKVSGKQ